MSGWAIRGACCFRIRRILHRFAPPNSATWRGSSRNSTSAASRSSGSASTVSTTTRSGRKTSPQSAAWSRVATENRIRAGADAAMGYPRLGMLDLLKLLSRLLVGLFRSHAAREAETAFLRQQLVVLKRSAPARLRLRTADRLIFVWLDRLCPSVREAAVVFKPETLVRWHRSGFR